MTVVVCTACMELHTVRPPLSDATPCALGAWRILEDDRSTTDQLRELGFSYVGGKLTR